MTKYIIDPLDLDVNSLYTYLINNITFNDLLSLYIKLRIKISTGSDNNE